MNFFIDFKKDGENMTERKSMIKLIKQLDWKLIIIVLCIFSFGLLILSSATHANETGNYFQLYKQFGANQ